MSRVTRREFLHGVSAVLAAASFVSAVPGVAFAAPAAGSGDRSRALAPAAGPAIGSPLDRLDGPLKVRGAATYAYEHPVDRPTYLYPVLSTIARGRVARIDARAAAAEPGVLVVLTHENAPRLVSTDRRERPNLVPTSDPELAVLQSDAVAFRGQIVGAVVAESLETARHAAGLVRVEYEEQTPEVAFGAGRPDLRRPVNAANAGYGVGEIQDGSPADTAVGDLDAGLASAAATLDATYTTPTYHHNPMEPHTTVAIWADDALTLYTSTQGVHRTRATVAPVLGLEPERVRVISPHVGGGFGAKGYVHAEVILAALAAQAVPGRPVKLALTRQQMFSLVGYRTPTIQRIRLGADAVGRLTAVAHDVVQQTSSLKEFAEQTATCSRLMYAAPNRRTSHRLAALDMPPPTIMRAPGEAPGMWALESAMDELASALGVDPVELRIRNEPPVHPESGRPFSSRHLAACLREGARRFGWEGRDPTPRARRERGWLVGTGVAASTYPAIRFPGNRATIRAGADGRYAVLIGAADLGTGAWTALTQIAADALGVPVEVVDLQIGDSALPLASNAGYSTGTASWGTVIVEAATQFRARLQSEYGGAVPAEGLEVTADLSDNPSMGQLAMYSFGAQFAEVRVHEDTGEVRVPRMLGVFDVGRIINPKTARSQLLGGMTMGLSMALHEHSVVDRRYGHVANHDFAGYHIAANADVGSVEVHWLDEPDTSISAMGAKGLGEVGIVGTAAAIGNAVYHATGIRVRDLPITLDKLLR